MGVADSHVARFRVHRATEAGQERLLQAAGAERLNLVRIERAGAREQLVTRRETVIDPKADLVDVLRLLTDGRQVLEPGAGSRLRHVEQKRRGERIDTVRRDAIAGEWRATAGTGVDRDWIADRREAGKVAAPQGLWRNGECPRE